MATGRAGFLIGGAVASSEDLQRAIKDIVDAAKSQIPTMRKRDALEAQRVRFLGRESGLLTKVFTDIATLPKSDRAAAGQAANEAKRAIEDILAREVALIDTQVLDLTLSESADLTLPPRRVRLGRLHPISKTIREITRVLATMGFEAVEGPEVEFDYYNFEALNIPRDHPARDKFNTLWIANPLGDDPTRPVLLRTHTSPMQIRVMEQRKPPVRVVVPGRCYRFEATDATHESIFFQYEGLAIDGQLTMADLKGVLYSFARQLFGGERKVKFRPDYFPFTEPSAEIAFDCFICDGTGTTNMGRCATCGGSGWIEAAGCGMVHPEALRRVGYDPTKVQGFAFGGGVERLAMLLTGTPDIRLFHENDLRYLETV
jgi:phenylalanyl-tRNA synthetase alpha chain